MGNLSLIAPLGCQTTLHRILSERNESRSTRPLHMTKASTVTPEHDNYTVVPDRRPTELSLQLCQEGPCSTQKQCYSRSCIALGGLGVLISPNGSEVIQLKGQDEHARDPSTILALFYTVRWRVRQSSCLPGSSPLLVDPVACLCMDSPNHE